MIDYLQPPLGYLLRIPCGDSAAESLLDEPARDRAERAAAFLRFERIGQILALPLSAAHETAQIVWLGCSPDFYDQVDAGVTETFLELLKNPDRGLPCVFVVTQGELQLVLKSLGVSQANQPGDADANEIVAPGGIISIHRGDAGEIAVRARHMIMDFSFTDFVKAAAWGGADIAVERPATS